MFLSLHHQNGLSKALASITEMTIHHRQVRNPGTSSWLSYDFLSYDLSRNMSHFTLRHHLEGFLNSK